MIMRIFSCTNQDHLYGLPTCQAREHWLRETRVGCHTFSSNVHQFLLSFVTNCYYQKQETLIWRYCSFRMTRHFNGTIPVFSSLLAVSVNFSKTIQFSLLYTVSHPGADVQVFEQYDLKTKNFTSESVTLGGKNVNYTTIYKPIKISRLSSQYWLINCYTIQQEKRLSTIREIC